jgi:hypothetical protein
LTALCKTGCRRAAGSGVGQSVRPSSSCKDADSQLSCTQQSSHPWHCHRCPIISTQVGSSSNALSELCSRGVPGRRGAMARSPSPSRSRSSGLRSADGRSSGSSSRSRSRVALRGHLLVPPPCLSPQSCHLHGGDMAHLRHKWACMAVPGSGPCREPSRCDPSSLTPAPAPRSSPARRSVSPAQDAPKQRVELKRGGENGASAHTVRCDATAAPALPPIAAAAAFG